MTPTDEDRSQRLSADGHARTQLVLSGETTGDVILDLFKYLFMFKTGFPLADLLDRLDLDFQMVDCAHRSGRRHQRKVEGRGLQVELGIVRHFFCGFTPKTFS